MILKIKKAAHTNAALPDWSLETEQMISKTETAVHTYAALPDWS